MCDVQRDNERILCAAGMYLNEHPCAITPRDVEEIANGYIGEEEAFALLLAAWWGMDLERREDMLLYRRYLPGMLQKLEPEVILEDAYVKAVRFDNRRIGRASLSCLEYAPMELFVRDDFVILPDDRVLPQLGWFDRRVPYPAILEDGRIWMTVTPNEINTIRPAAEQSRGKVLAYGLGLGYYAFHALRNPQVTSVTVVERSQDVIDLFRQAIAPQFPHADRLHIIQADAFAYARERAQQEDYNTVFVDLWHDVGDGLPLYRRMKALEYPGPRYMYWIEKTMRAYMVDDA